MFRCKTCGHLCDIGAAGVNPTPSACPVCGMGATYKPGGHDPDPTNWEVLGEYVPSPEKDAAENLERCKAAHAKLVEKEARWKAERAAIAERYHAVADAHDALVKAGPGGQTPRDLEKHATAVADLKQQARDLESAEFTPRDAAHKAKLEETIANGGRENGKGGKLVTVNVLERAKTFDRAN